MRIWLLMLYVEGTFFFLLLTLDHWFWAFEGVVSHWFMFCYYVLVIRVHLISFIGMMDSCFMRVSCAFLIASFENFLCMNPTREGWWEILRLQRLWMYWKNISCGYVERVCSRCITCKQAKSRVFSQGLYIPLPIPYEPSIDIFMDFILSLPRIRKSHDSIFVVVDRFSNMAYFIPSYKTDCQVAWHFENYYRWQRCQVPEPFWKVLCDKLGTKLLFSTFCYPQINGQIEVVNMTLSTLLIAVVKGNLKSWEDCIRFVEFAYNRNVYLSSSFSSFEIVYEFNYLTPLGLVHLLIDEITSLIRWQEKG